MGGERKNKFQRDKGLKTKREEVVNNKNTEIDDNGNDICLGTNESRLITDTNAEQDSGEPEVDDQSTELKKINEVLKDEIRKHNKTLDALRKSEQRYKSLVENLPVRLARYDLIKKDYDYWKQNKMWIEMTLDEYNKLGEEERISYLHPDDFKRVYPIYSKWLRSEENETLSLEYRFRNKEGKYQWIECLFFKEFSPEGKLLARVELSWDISERKRIEKELDEYRDNLEKLIEERTSELEKTNQELQELVSEHRRIEKQVRILTQEVLKAQENERQKISRELHDNIAQNLSFIRIDLETFFSDPQHNYSDIKKKKDEISKRIHQTVDEIRNMTYELHPSGLEVLGLVSCVLHYCKEFSNSTEIKVDFRSTGMGKVDFNHDTQINLFRLVQEALNNVRKHADATRVSVKMVASIPNLILRIEDNGKGFNVEKQLAESLNERRMGLHAMNERASLLGGRLKIHSNLNSGTKIVVEVPIQEKNNGKSL